MKQEIINRFDVMVDYLKEVQTAIREGKDLERIDALDTLNFVAVTLYATCDDLKVEFNLSEQ